MLSEMGVNHARYSKFKNGSNSHRANINILANTEMNLKIWLKRFIRIFVIVMQQKMEDRVQAMWNKRV